MVLKNDDVLSLLRQLEAGAYIKPRMLVELTNITEWSLMGSEIIEIPKTVGRLSSLKKLDIRGTGIAELPESLFQLDGLEALYLSNTQITSLPESIGRLSGLITLDLRGADITELPESIGLLKRLNRLYLSGSKISSLPESLTKLTNLKELYLNTTRIAALPEWLGQVSGLEYLDLKGLTLPFIPKSLALCGLPFVEDSFFWLKGKRGINLYGVTLTEQNKSVFLENPELIPELYEEPVPVQESKVIFLGDGESGKSYTIKRFRAEGKKEAEDNLYLTSETPGVEILDYETGTGAEQFTIHFWDFGGQQLLHSMHRCFLTEETCYVITVKSRESRANQRARYWLRNVQSFAPNSPVLLFVNCWENDDGHRSIDEPRLRKDFPNVREVLYCSAKQAEDEVFAEKLMRPIFKLAREIADGRSINKKWNAARLAIQKEKQNYLTKERYHELCGNAGIVDENALPLLNLFNNLGVCFSYHRDEKKQELADYKLLSPVWLTNAIYAIIEEGRAYAQEGRIPTRAAEQMLGNSPPDKLPEIDNYRRTVPELVYAKEECGYVLDVAAAYNLCYRLEDARVFFPALCGTDTPDAALSPPEGFPLHVSWQLHYPYLPDSVVHQLMVRSLRRKLFVEHCWLRGMVLRGLEKNEAHIRMEDNDDKTLCIDVWTQGPRLPYELFWMLRGELQEINRSLKLEPKEYLLTAGDRFSVQAVFSAVKRNESLTGDSGDRYDPRELLGMAFDQNVVQEMPVENGVIVIPVIPRSFHRCDKSDRELRNALYETYNRICPYCGERIQSLREMQVDHILPSAYNTEGHPGLEQYESYLTSCGFDLEKPDYIENYFPSHGHCNRDKGKYVNEYSLPYWHGIAAMHTPKILKLMKQAEHTNP